FYKSSLPMCLTHFIVYAFSNSLTNCCLTAPLLSISKSESVESTFISYNALIFLLSVSPVTSITDGSAVCLINDKYSGWMYQSVLISTVVSSSVYDATGVFVAL